MKYFIVSVDKNYNAPTLTEWNGIKGQNIRKIKKSYQMSKHMFFIIENHMQTVFTDVITFPCFMVSKKIKDVVEWYDSSVKFVRIILFDKSKKRSKAYYIPFLRDIDFATVNKKGSDIELFIEEEKIRNYIVFQVTKLNRIFVVMRMDLLESILRRGALGVGIKETYLI